MPMPSKHSCLVGLNHRKPIEGQSAISVSDSQTGCCLTGALNVKLAFSFASVTWSGLSGNLRNRTILELLNDLAAP